MATSKKYLFYFLACTISELVILLCFRNRLVLSYSLTIYLLMTDLFFFARFIFNSYRITKYIREEHPLLYERNSLRLFKIRLVSSFLLMDKDVQKILKSELIEIYTEYKLGWKYFAITSFSFIVLTLRLYWV